MAFSHLFDDFDAKVIRLFQEEYEAGHGTLRVKVHLPRKDQDDDPATEDHGTETSLLFELESGQYITMPRRARDRRLSDDELRERIRKGILLYPKRGE